MRTYRQVLGDIDLLSMDARRVQTTLTMVRAQLEKAYDLLETMRAEILNMQLSRPSTIADTPNDKAVDKFLEGR